MGSTVGVYTDEEIKKLRLTKADIAMVKRLVIKEIKTSPLIEGVLFSNKNLKTLHAITKDNKEINAYLRRKMRPVVETVAKARQAKEAERQIRAHEKQIHELEVASGKVTRLQPKGVA